MFGQFLPNKNKMLNLPPLIHYSHQALLNEYFCDRFLSCQASSFKERKPNAGWQASGARTKVFDFPLSLVCLSYKRCRRPVVLTNSPCQILNAIANDPLLPFFPSALRFLLLPGLVKIQSLMRQSP
jgi:hypothetical protein